MLYRYYGPPSESALKSRYTNKYCVLSCSSETLDENWQPSTSRSSNKFLVWRLTTSVFIHYMYNHGRKLNGFVFNKRIEKIVVNDNSKTKTIPLEHIRRHETVLGEWYVQSQTASSYLYNIVEPYTSYVSCFGEGCIKENMCKHQLAVIKPSTDISWGIILEIFNTYYEFLRDRIRTIFELSIPIGLF